MRNSTRPRGRGEGEHTAIQGTDVGESLHCFVGGGIIHFNPFARFTIGKHGGASLDGLVDPNPGGVIEGHAFGGLIDDKIDNGKFGNRFNERKVAAESGSRAAPGSRVTVKISFPPGALVPGKPVWKQD